MAKPLTRYCCNCAVNALSWSAINIVAILLMLGVITFSFDPNPPVLMAIAIVRIIVDYWNGREFYFPKLA
jgi:hypothetical protein